MRLIAIGLTMSLALGSAATLAAEEVDVHKVYSPQEIKWSAAPASLPAGAQMAVLYGDPQRAGAFVLRVKMPKGYQIAPHMHKQSEMLTVISGALSLGLGPAADRNSVQQLSAGSFSSMPHGVAHYVLAKEDTIVQINAEGPWSIDYVNAKDDPRLNGVDPSTSGLYSSKSP
jgi:quercetin dioxygenase-like cupin family protein